MATLPAAFAELEPFAGWALPTEKARYEKRLSSSMQDLQAWLNARTTRDPAIFWSTQGNYRGGGTSTNRFGYENPELEKLIADGAAETDPEKRKKLYQQANETQIEQSNVINVATNPRVIARETPNETEFASWRIVPS